MAIKKRASLGRGLDKLLSTSSLPVSDSDVATKEELVENSKQGELTYIPVELIQRGEFQPRRDMDLQALEELASSIRSQGVLQPVVVRPIEKDRYELIAGERRWRASQLAELEAIPAIIKSVSDEDTMAMALIENIQRENLNPMEEAMAISRLIEEFAMTHQAVAQTLGKSRASVTNLLRLMGLNTEVKELLTRGDIELGHAKVLLALEGPLQAQAAKIVVAKGLSVRETEQLIKRLQSPAKQLYTQKSVDPDIRQLQAKLSEKLGAQVKIQYNNKGKGKLVIHYSSLEELDGILEQIN